MTLYEKIVSLYDTLTLEDFGPRGTIVLQNENDSRGDYIAKWEHPTLAQPTKEQLEAIE
jgi:hypothetical protein